MENYHSLDQLRKLSEHEFKNVFFTDGRPDRPSERKVMEQILRRMQKREPTFPLET